MLDLSIHMTVDARVGTQDHTAICLGEWGIVYHQHFYTIRERHRSSTTYTITHLSKIITNHIQAFPTQHPLQGIPINHIQWRIRACKWEISTGALRCDGPRISIRQTTPCPDIAWSPIPDIMPIVHHIQDSLTLDVIAPYAHVFRNPRIHPFLDGLECRRHVFSADTHPNINVINNTNAWHHRSINVHPSTHKPQDIPSFGYPEFIKILDLNTSILDYRMGVYIRDDTITHLIIMNTQCTHAMLFIPYTKAEHYTHIHDAIASLEATYTHHRAMAWRRHHASNDMIRIVLDTISSLENDIHAWNTHTTIPGP